MKKIVQKSSLIAAMFMLAVILAVPTFARGGDAHAEDMPSDGTSEHSEMTTDDSPEPADTESNDDSSTTISDHETEQRAERQAKVEAKRAEVKAAMTDRKEAGKARLEAAKLKACQNREKAITNIMSRISDRGQKHLTLFSTIAERTEAFYVKQGKTLATYDQLVADVAAKKAAAQTAVDAVAAQDSSFSCDSDNPKAVVDSFKASLQSEIKALQEYRTSVKNLIVGVKSVQSTTDENKGTE